MTTALEFALAHMDMARGMIVGMLKDVPPAGQTAQFDGARNHFLWTYGHIAVSYALFTTCIETKASSDGGVPAGWNKLFGFGSIPSANANDYPPIAEVLAFGERAYAEFRAAAAKMTEAELSMPVVNEEARSFLENRMAALLMCAWHDGWHAGQLSGSRRALGLPGVMGS